MIELIKNFLEFKKLYKENKILKQQLEHYAKFIEQSINNMNISTNDFLRNIENTLPNQVLRIDQIIKKISNIERELEKLKTIDSIG